MSICRSFFGIVSNDRCRPGAIDRRGSQAIGHFDFVWDNSGQSLLRELAEHDCLLISNRLGRGTSQAEPAAYTLGACTICLPIRSFA
jgi:hypothetical protein